MTPTPVVVPDLGELVETVRIVRWVKEVGDAVALDEEILEVSTEKIDVSVQSPVAGVMAEIRAVAGEKVKVGAVVAVVDSD